MSLYELRTYTLYVGRLSEAIELYKNEAWPALQQYEKYLVGYFIGDVGALNQIIHVWKFEDDAERRQFWEELPKNKEFMAFVKKFRPMLISQENKLMRAAPWGPKP